MEDNHLEEEHHHHHHHHHHHYHHQEEQLQQQQLQQQLPQQEQQQQVLQNHVEAAVNTNENILNNVERDLQENGTQRRNNRTGNNLNPRDRLFYALFIKIGQLYARLVRRKYEHYWR